MSKPVLYVFGGSVWSAALSICSAELFSEGGVEYQTINLMKGENFAPSFIRKNPNATLPTLEAEGQVYTSTAEVTSYLVKKASTKVKPANPEFIDILHADKLDPNFALFLFRDDEEHKAKSELGNGFLGGRQAALEEYSVHPEAEPHKSFYDGKIASNGEFLALYQGKAPKDEFFSQSYAHFNNIATFFKENLVSYLPLSGFIGGEIPDEDDYHLGAWLTRIAASLGAKNKDDAISAFEKGFKGPVPAPIVSYWRAWTERASWIKVYPELH
ncbi:hypothetical protein J3R30DRAFT_3655536 [Lentinula aciculospora]|uniref:GST N-terminal domain-containing protein n=1 Tax=Lentinula aciculospora TaxID=153920 RepID=A0A9W9ANV5_9AGAR|nr:hypothetical protein J3R30DRAFT_3655536 [Lentinula aciculospora]